MFQLTKEDKFKKILSYFILQFLFFTNISYSNYSQVFIPEVDESIEIKFKKKNLEKFYNFLSDINYSKLKTRNEKKWIDVKIIYNGKEIESKIRINGSPTTMDHIDFARGVASLHVKLINGNIEGMKRFRLLLPRSKSYENEIFWSLMMETLNHPTPYTRFVNVKFQNKLVGMIFQEKAESSFLKRWQIGYSPVLEGNSSYWMYKQVKCMQLSKEDFLNCFSKETSDLIQVLKIENNSFLKEKNMKLAFDSILSNVIYQNKKFLDMNKNFASHGLTFKNSKYFYDNYYRFRVNIYFDGDVTFKNFNKDNCKNTKVDRSSLDNFKHEYSKRSLSNFSRKYECIFKYYFSKKDNFFKKMNINDVNLKLHKKTYSQINSDLEFITFSTQDNKFYICKNEFYCESADKNLVKQFLAGSHKLYDKTSVQKIVLDSDRNKVSQKYVKEIIEYDDQIINIDKNTTKYLSFQKNITKININLESTNSSRLIIIGNLPSNLKIYFHFKNYDPLQNKNFIFPSECITFVDSSFYKLDLYFSNNNCNEPLKFFRSSGTIKLNNINQIKKNKKIFQFSKIKLIN